ncbi:cryptochrome/photolyase family protein [Halopseudomonas pelagia]|uniref:Cryptochrome/photolyase family protein n=1 Tax=Halopseudomonas pelagia TaxID=553151 RepID=A0AA91U4Y8_9GAMM|nr:cryptochrome/photolyase family protein [Halopseudomonas pelagia]PCD00776.1 cryptochrome/photolyase family protein [Halopseudomonas pelagia]QFY58066.1 cryptochrome/photolyase family protein [Halopseudomonas pelagia]
MSVRHLILILGDQLDDAISSLRDADPQRDRILMAEVMEEGRYVPHHPQKILFVLSAMRHFAEQLRAEGFTVDYVRLDDAGNSGTLLGELERARTRLAPERILLCKPSEWRLLDIFQQAQQRWPELQLRDDERFFCTQSRFEAWAKGRKQLRMELFYREMRKHTHLLMDPDGGPAGGAWNYDADNRKALPASVEIPPQPHFPSDAITQEVQALVAERFADHYGVLEGFDYPVTRDAAEMLWAHFLELGMPSFGDYQDAMADNQPYLFHARIAAAMNVGLLDPRRVCLDVQVAWQAGDIPLNAAEGFIRQILGWREYVRGIYWLMMPDYAERNALGNQRDLPEFYWTGETRMNCMSQAIGQTLEHAYAHHIQRLMVTGNFALLTGVQPKQICDWYLAVYMDAFDWVELPNTLGMVMHADGGYLGSKPYCASGQYIKRMSNHCKGCAYKVTEQTGEKACPFNSLYWHFLMRHRDKLGANHRLAMVYRNLDRMPDAKQQALWAWGEKLLARLDAGQPL